MSAKVGIGRGPATFSALAVALALALISLGGATAASAAARCSPGARTLASPGSRVYPETGNGNYTSVHTDVFMVYDAAGNRFLPGNHVVLTERSKQCLSSFSLDFERSSANRRTGPDMTVSAVTVDGQPATFAFVQPTYPGDPIGPDDPNPAAHEASQQNPVGGPDNNPLPPACSPELLGETPSRRDSLDGTQCPANKLLITPTTPVRASATFAVDVYYAGRPGVHNDGDGSTEGWFRTSGGSFVATEPVGTEDWMPLNNHPSAKPTYDFFETVQKGKVAVANGVLQGTTTNAPSSGFPRGSVTWHWHSAAPIASYLVQGTVGDYALIARTTLAGITFYEAQDEGISATARARNAKLIAMQPEITEFETRWGGPFPFSSDGTLVGTSSEVGFEEEMQTMIAFSGGEVDLPTLWHENSHQWWGDSVSESSYEQTFFKEGLADWMESYVFPARRRSAAAFDAQLIKRFNATYQAGGSFWTIAPSKPFSYSLFDGAATYERPAAAYEALRQILGEQHFAQALRQIQQEHAGSVVTEPQLQQAFREALPSNSAACEARLSTFFAEWFDTAYARGGGPAGRPQITGPGLHGQDFYDGGCAAGGD